MEKQYYVYILTNKIRTVLYIGMTSNLVGRVWEHKEKAIKSFTEKFNVSILVYYEVFIDPYNAITREKNLKKWEREWKENLINKNNPNWKDLYDGLT